MGEVVFAAGVNFVGLVAYEEFIVDGSWFIVKNPVTKSINCVPIIIFKRLIVYSKTPLTMNHQL